MKEAREMGLPSGITFEEVEKFNEILRKHGDSKQNQAYFEQMDKKDGQEQEAKKPKQTSYDLPDMQLVAVKPKSGACMCVMTGGAGVWHAVRGKIGEKPIVDYNCGETFSPDADLSALSVKMWDLLTYPLGINKFRSLIGEAKQATVVHIGMRGADHLDQEDRLDNLLAIDMIEDHIKSDTIKFLEDVSVNQLIAG